MISVLLLIIHRGLVAAWPAHPTAIEPHRLCAGWPIRIACPARTVAVEIWQDSPRKCSCPHHVRWRLTTSLSETSHKSRKHRKVLYLIDSLDHGHKFTHACPPGQHPRVHLCEMNDDEVPAVLNVCCNVARTVLIINVKTIDGAAVLALDHALADETSKHQ